MTKLTKDSIAVVSACVMLLFGITLTAIGFSIKPTGEVHDSVLWILGQSLIYAGGIFGIATYTKHMVDKRVDDWRNEIRRENEKEGNEQNEQNENDV